jgi:hypothetical protein
MIIRNKHAIIVSGDKYLDVKVIGDEKRNA